MAFKGLVKILMALRELAQYENHFKFNLDSWRDDEEATNIMREVISPRILPANFTSGKSAIGYEFCYPSVVARQLGFV